MVKDRKQIRKFAKALFNTAIQLKSVEQTALSLSTMASLFENNPDILSFFGNIFQSEERHQQVLNSIAKEADLDPLASEYFNILLELRHLNWVPMIFEYYQRLADDYLEQERATVYTPTSLEGIEKKSLINSLSSMTGKKILLHEEIDPSLIAGVSVRIGSMIFDGSLSNQLQRIEKEICDAR
ncbi:ATP synthase F1 subunit delta [candidate division CSSED10-310 bacterium]|uniref:ATP synthase subunit delta n=1 Tax=candidate division CSSED10-310 bacterium TaxID=2855610 RepID=A0ABV6YU72_UNCC1